MAPAHVLVFPWPLQGHINCMLHFAAGLVGAGLHVTFLHTEHNLARVDPLASAAATPRLRFVSVPDGLPAGHPRTVRDLKEPLLTTVPAAYRALLASLQQQPSTTADAGFPPVSCVVADGLLPFAIDIPEEEFGVPALAFRTVSACSILAYLSVPRLVELGEAIPIPLDADLDELVLGVPGMEGFLRRRDLPSPCRVNAETQEADPLLDMIVDFTAHSRDKARALILNTAASLEGESLAHIAEQMRGDVFAIGPLHLHAAANVSSSSSSPAPVASGSMWREDGGCIEWLDAQGDRSVVYVSLGSLTVISLEQFTEFLSGLVGAGHAFLWVLRPDMVTATQNALLREAVDAAAALHGNAAPAAFVVDWAPQRAVLRHRAVGCFLTHAGWNSTVECAAEGVPMVCWPFFADQQINSRFVGAVWGTGLDMKDVCDRAVVEAMVREAMESAGIRRSAVALAERVRRDVEEGGSSAVEFDRLVGFIKELAATKDSVANQ
ncbi:7-deoxyloganetic acid glucosyltransferase [Brachypodium distachyon]|nr:7-deoxyloganetic acid glucosyltransferase [Brachypodium distachyon]|eukprot:XP_024319140.1 7-deoxyloganetic acid glucosyltransferase [Brachypodium distachyon]